ncbi:hypothetical protein Tsp_11722 [Trichinella spiralis]|uniref:hypothetical protein n=1 Tax=Trichinella spiralis TaxID=6334 RepID=UPI0001EFE6E2|nr:hypothetical protein Tsp_11722 [Trichinella spiralis]
MRFHTYMHNIQQCNCNSVKMAGMCICTAIFYVPPTKLDEQIFNLAQIFGMFHGRLYNIYKKKRLFAERCHKSAKSCGHMSCKSIFVLGFAKRDTFTFKTVSFQLEFEYCPLVDFLFPIVGFYVKLNEKLNGKTSVAEDKQAVLIEVINESHLSAKGIDLCLR